MEGLLLSSAPKRHCHADDTRNGLECGPFASVNDSLLVKPRRASPRPTRDDGGNLEPIRFQIWKPAPVTSSWRRSIPVGRTRPGLQPRRWTESAIVVVGTEEIIVHWPPTFCVFFFGKLTSRQNTCKMSGVARTARQATRVLERPACVRYSVAARGALRTTAKATPGSRLGVAACTRHFSHSSTWRSVAAPVVEPGGSKLRESADEAVADIQSGSVLLSSGFGLCGVACT